MKGAHVAHLGSFVRGLEIEPRPGAHTSDGEFPDAAGLLTHATEFLYAACPDYEWQISIRKRWQPDGSHMWAVYFGDRRVWDKKAGQFIHEGGDALDCKRHLQRCRFKTLRVAWEHAGLGVAARRAQEAEWAVKRQETEEKIARANLLDAARTGCSLAFLKAEEVHGIGFWDLVEQGAVYVTVEEPDGTKRPKLALTTANQVEQNAEALRKGLRGQARRVCPALNVRSLAMDSCKRCPNREVVLTKGYGYAEDWKCKAADGRMIAGCLEWPSEEPKSIPDWCPLHVVQAAPQ